MSRMPSKFQYASGETISDGDAGYVIALIPARYVGQAQLKLNQVVRVSNNWMADNIIVCLTNGIVVSASLYY